jgi:hypothetical protein
VQVIWQDFFSFQRLGRKVCDSWAAPAKTNAQGYRHANYALPDTRVFVSHLSQIFLPNRWKLKKIVTKMLKPLQKLYKLDKLKRVKKEKRKRKWQQKTEKYQQED